MTGLERIQFTGEIAQRYILEGTLCTGTVLYVQYKMAGDSAVDGH